jgi:hypothetical protein
MDERTATAYHEAGHAVAALLLGVGFKSVSIVETEDTLGRLLHSEPPAWWWEAVEEADYASTWGQFIPTRTRRRVEQRIILALAGAETESEATDRPQEEVDAGAGIFRLSPEEAKVMSERAGGPVHAVLGPGDYSRALDLACKVSGDDDEGAAYLEWLHRRTLNLMRDPFYWPGVEALASALLERDTLSYRAVRRLWAEALDKTRRKLPGR